MPAGRVLATQQAKDAASQLLALTGSVKEQVRRVLQQGSTLADPHRWDGGLAGKWRNDWGPDATQLSQTAAKLDQLEHRAQQVIDDIFNADSTPPGNVGTRFDQAMIPAEGTNPAEVNAWWQALNPTQQQGLISEFPAQMGSLDGLPAIARNQANRAVLAADRQQLQDQLAGLEAHPPPETESGGGRFGTEEIANPAWAQWQQQVGQIKDKLAGIDAVENGLARGGQDGYPSAYLLGFDTVGNGHAIVSFGNPDTADNTVTYVPGLGSTLTGAFGDSNRAAVLWQQAHRYDPSSRIASIYWLNYNAPQLGLSQGLSNFDVASTSDAVAGAPTLSRFQSGLHAAHQPGIPDHTVVLGHSYGSLVVGEAAAHNGMHPGDLIFVGSPGVGVNHATQLDISPAHTWAGENANDPVPDLPPVNPLLWFNNYSSHFGDDPTSPEFGGRDFAATYDPRSSDFNPFLYGGELGGELGVLGPAGPQVLTSITGSDYFNIKTHSSYWDYGSISLQNMAHIVDGQYSQVIPQRGR